MSAAAKSEVTTKIFTIPNLISFARLCLVPVFAVLLLDGHNGLACLVFAIAASSDFIDGYLARSTGNVSKLGQFLDPLVDRALLITGVVCLLVVGRLPLWVILVVIARDIYLVASAAHLMYHYNERIAVILPGKVATTLLYIGFAGLLLNMPQGTWLHVTDFSWLPGFNGVACSWGIWFVYAGLILSLIVTIIYIRKGWAARCRHYDENGVRIDERTYTLRDALKGAVDEPANDVGAEA
ncbi:CDP-diacylglycerol--glycerol-3-phosphate 3-phosphatidyltransferase [Slackia heliotrinireducens]|uniref:Phosphatidylglycerophosphate synthase n=1 Tax=Slackia heliotrinireducens (strain ATCC 29202 / DSM 20476 / NCTC 11029 / RHS 1) TaxID=471855 RepID=C7N628_SLAHD|nr:CDP-alcohol phosphatidyltransferase family protein [Slackia heliotrinireducens]ACV22363.1 phosphatidylglycerophosphate synthase [Slackia heliotrinireducens DSM 20476]VEH00639.1 CDP-diacylglycerol--glycerol-3-phosphate 3-phosphatidyltransferase [Slackia heliotrinireducens]